MILSARLIGRGARRTPVLTKTLLCVAVLSLSGAASAFAQCTLNSTPTACTLTGANFGNTDSFVADPGSTTTASGPISNAGSIAIVFGNNSNTFLNITGDTTLSGAGTMSLQYSGSGAGQVFVEQSGGGFTLTNESNIVGTGIIGNGGLTISNSGTINANAGANAVLTLNGSGGISNTGLLEATGGTLQLSTGVNNVGGNITANGANAIVNVSSTITGGALNVLNGGTLQTSGTATLDGSTGGGANAVTISGSYTGGPGTTTNLLGNISGNLAITAGSNANTTLNIVGNTTLQNGTLTLAYNGSGAGQVFVQQSGGGFTLTNSNGNTIQGQGLVGNGGLTLNNAGTVNANAGPGAVLTLNGSGGVTNTNLLEATNGTLQLSTAVNNVGGNITANGGNAIVNVSSTITGGTLNVLNGGTVQTSGTATLDGSTNAVTILGGAYTAGPNSTTNVSGTISGSLALTAGSNANTNLNIVGNTILQNGTLTLAYNGSGAGQVFVQQSGGGFTLTNAGDNTIQGQGTIGNGGLTLNNLGVVNANAGAGAILTLNGSGGVTNTNLLEATSGTLQLSTVINNAGGQITANGANAIVNVSSTISGGTLNTSAGGTLQTISSATLDGSANAITLSSGSTYTGGVNTFTNVKGSIINKGNINLTAGSNANTALDITGNTSLSGGGTVTLNYNGSGAGAAYIQQSGGSFTLTNGATNTIQGQGVIGNGGLTLVNQGTVTANQSGGTLILNGSGGVTNTNLLTATNGGILSILNTTVANNGGQITGDGGTVLIGSSTIQGGTLGGTLQTNSSATLDGSTGQGALTIASGSVYTAGLSTDTNLAGSIINQGNISVTAGSNANTSLDIIRDTTLSGNGTVTLSYNGIAAGASYIQQSGGSFTLTNAGNTIQGSGVIGNGGLTVINGAQGTILANAAGQTLTINGSGGLTNNGTLQVVAGSNMVVSSNLTNFSGGTLTGGTYIVQGTAASPGTLQITSLGNTGGEIARNAATIVLNGPTAAITDNANLNALSKFQDNLAAGSFTVENGQQFVTAPGANFQNEGNVTVADSASGFTTEGVYNQDGANATTTVNGTLTSGFNAVNIEDGVLNGNGTIVGNVDITANGTISPGDPGAPQAIRITGDYSQAGTLDELLGGTVVGQFGQILISGTGTLEGGSTLDVSLVNGFVPAGTEQFLIVDATGGAITGQFTNVDFLNNTFGDTLSVDYSQEANGEVFLDVTAPSTSATPEPGEFLPLAGLIGALAVWKIRRKRSAAA